MPPQNPLQLESFFVESLSYQARQGFDRNQPPREQVDVRYSPLFHKDTPNRIMVRLEVAVGQREMVIPRCELNLKLVGFFALPEGLADNVKTAMITQNAPSILYGIARQIVAETTGNGPWGKVFLPTVNFVAMAADKARTARPARTKADSPVVSDKPSATKR